MDNYLVDIIIPTYNRPLLLQRALKSALVQTYPNIRQIIVTDDSTDGNAEEIVMRFALSDTRVIYFRNVKYPHGPAGNKNNGLDCIKNDYFLILDDDDILMPDSIEVMIGVIREHKQKVVLANTVLGFNGSFMGNVPGPTGEYNYNDLLSGRLEGEYLVLQKSSLLNGERFISEANSSEAILWLDIWKDQPIYYINRALRVYSVDNISRVSNLFFSNPASSLIYYDELLQKFGNVIMKLNTRRHLRVLLIAAMLAKLSGKNWKVYLSSAEKNHGDSLLLMGVRLICLFPVKVVLGVAYLYRLLKKTYGRLCTH